MALESQNQMTEGRPSSLPRRRDKGTRRSVIIADRIADGVIRVGGIGVIIAVFAIMAFLIQSVVPLFTGGSAGARFDGKPQIESAAPVFERIDEQNLVAVRVALDGSVLAYHIPTGQPLDVRGFDLSGARATAFGSAPNGAHLAFGFADGSLQFARLVIATSLIAEPDLPADLRALNASDRTDGQAVFSPAPGGQFRRVSVSASLGDRSNVLDGVAITQIDLRMGGTDERPTSAYAVLGADGSVKVSREEQRKNMMTGALTKRAVQATLPPLPMDLVPVSLLITASLDQVYVGSEDGRLFRFDARRFDKLELAETVQVVPEGARLTALSFLNGEQSLLVGASNGAVNVYFRVQSDAAKTTDGREMVLAHRLEPNRGAVRAFASSARSKMFASVDATGQIVLRHATSEQTLLRLTAPEGAETATLALAPRDNAILLSSPAGSYHAWPVHVPHPETTWASIFGKVWYEGYAKPSFTWQSSSGTDAFEPKFSLMPLIFGTIKAAFYSLLFAVPIAVGAAIYTSEFLHRSARAVIKPAMEMMASLPSVVLGFIAALILAPLVETWISAVLLAGILLPVSLFIGAFLWQLLPIASALRFGGVPKFALMFVALGLTVLVSQLLAPGFEKVFFAGDLKAWANGDIGSDVPFLSLVLLPFCFLAIAAILDRTVNDRINDWIGAKTRFVGGLADVGRWLATVAAAFLMALVLAQLLAAADLGVRGGLVGTYVQRNTLVVGFAMGFAVIPIIYTIAEDALNSVPEHLRAASLACGATTWQTATRIIVPAAMSGIFAAIMVGLGRAVGETMIVVMAAGNTPVMDWNVFSGLRALSANIAVELPEAVRDETLYRMLFLAALVLFAMTFALNTLAESIRQKFRKRAAQL